MSIAPAGELVGLTTILVLLCSPALGQDEIVRQRGKEFSVFAPGSGSLYKSVDDAQHNRMDLEKYVLMRLQFARNLGTAGLLAFCDLDSGNPERYPAGVKVFACPAEAKTILVGLGPYVERLP